MALNISSVDILNKSCLNIMIILGLVTEVLFFN
jgi:hypothetical protein